MKWFLIGFVLTFALSGCFWRRHHRWYEYPHRHYYGMSQ